MRENILTTCIFKYHQILLLRIDANGNCNGVRIGERVAFNVSMTLLQCTVKMQS